MNVCRLLCYGFFILICPNMLNTTSVGLLACAHSERHSAVEALCGLEAVFSYNMTSALVKMNIFRKRCTLFHFLAEIFKFVS